MDKTSRKNPRVAMYDDGNGEWRWTFYAANGEAIAVSSEGYKDKDSCRRSIALSEAALGAKVVVESRPVTASRSKPESKVVRRRSVRSKT